MFLTAGVYKSPAGAFLPPVKPADPAVAAACIATAIAIGLISSFGPAWSAARTDIVEALRSTD